MVLIGKEEAKAIRRKFPALHLVRTCKQKSKRGRYFCEERPDVLAYITLLRKADVYCE